MSKKYESDENIPLIEGIAGEEKGEDKAKKAKKKKSKKEEETTPTE
mgnify:CR=1 FL=1